MADHFYDVDDSRGDNVHHAGDGSDLPLKVEPTLDDEHDNDMTFGIHENEVYE